MAMVVEVQVQSSSPGQQREIISRIHDLVTGNGFAVDQSSYTPEAAVLSELASVETSRATVKVHES